MDADAIRFFKYFMSTNKEKVSWITGLLTGWGIKESWAKVIAGAVIGALVAAGILTVTGCANWADVSLSSDQGSMTYTRDADGKVCVTVIPAVIDQQGK